LNDLNVEVKCFGRKILNHISSKASLPGALLLAILQMDFMILV
jgi:hypothetical protein